MTNKFNPTNLERLIDDVKEKWKQPTYHGGVTTAENIRTWIIADVHIGVLRHIGLSEHDGEKSRIKDMNLRREAELVDMVQRHWEGGICLARHLLKEAINEVLEDSRQKVKLKNESGA